MLAFVLLYLNLDFIVVMKCKKTACVFKILNYQWAYITYFSILWINI
jgi:hypothetical protein